MITMHNLKIGESKSVPRVWLEGSSLEFGGLQIGSTYAIDKLEPHRIELRRVSAGHKGQTFLVSQRTRGRVRPLMEIRSNKLRESFEHIEKVTVTLHDGSIVITANRLDVNMVRRALSLLNTFSRGQELSAMSVFHGGGVLDLAMHDGLTAEGVPVYVKAAVEMEDKYLASSLRNNTKLWRDSSVAVHSDIRHVDWPALGESNLFWGGIPCTGASISGRSKNKLKAAEEHVDAGALFMDFLDGVKSSNAAIVGFENVPEYQSTVSMMLLRAKLDTLGYDLYEMVLDGNTFGAVERRRRLLVLGVCRSLKTAFDINDVLPVRIKEATLRDIMEPVALDSPRWRERKGIAAKAIRDKADGKGFAPQQLTGDEAHCGTIGKGYAKCRGTEPFLIHPDNPSLLRILTPLEHGRAKGIPEGVADGQSDTTMHEIYGQSVIYPKLKALGAATGRLIREAALKFTSKPVRIVPRRPKALPAPDMQYDLPGLAASN